MGEKKVRPEDLTPEERMYYREVWRFDPVEDKVCCARLAEKTTPPDSNFIEVRPPVSPVIIIPKVIFYYDTSIPLGNDPELQMAGVILHVRVDFDEIGQSRNHIVFRRWERSAEVDCIRTLVYDKISWFVYGVPEETVPEQIAQTEDKPTFLPPWDHFAALKSFTSGLAEIGFLHLLDSDGYQSGFRPEFLDKLEGVLEKLAPEIIRPLKAQRLDDLLSRGPTLLAFAEKNFKVDKLGKGKKPRKTQDYLTSEERAYFMDLLDRISSKWSPQEWKWDQGYPLQLLFNNRAFLESLELGSRENALDIFLQLFDLEEEHEMETDGKESNRVLERLSPQIFHLYLTEDFVDGLSNGTLKRSFHSIQRYLQPEVPENVLKNPEDFGLTPEDIEYNPFSPYAKQYLTPVAALLIRRGLVRHIPVDLSVMPNPFELNHPEVTFNEEGFAVPELLHGFDTPYLRKILESVVGGGKIGEITVLSYHLLRLLFEREGLSPENREFLHRLAKEVSPEWAKRYFLALLREFPAVAQFLREERDRIKKEECDFLTRQEKEKLDRQRKAEEDFFTRQRGAADKELADAISFWEQRYHKKKEEMAKKVETVKKKQAEE